MSAHRTWVRIGSYLLAGGAATLLAGAASGEEAARLAPGALQLGEAGEGGEGGEGGGAPSQYAIDSTDPKAFDYDATATLAGYADLVHASYARATGEAEKLEAAVAALLADPGEATLAAARYAWLNARPAYLETETFRFYDGPIDVDFASGGEGPEGHVNAWPLNEAVIDYVAGAPAGGIVNDPSVALTAESILALDQAADEADVTTGWHAIEFLLWGQDLSASGPGARPASDFLAGQGNNDRRRLYLQTVTGMLVDELAALRAQWAAGEPGNYRARFLALPPREALGRVMNGMAQLAGFEMAAERLAVALDSGLQEDEHSCFSDNTHVDHIHDLRGIRNVWFGSVGGQQFPGLVDLALAVDPVAALMVTARLNAAEAALADIDRPFDQVLASPAGSPARQEAEQAVAALIDLAEALRQMGARLGVLVIVGG
jgi:putative iron-regulated protein